MRGVPKGISPKAAAILNRVNVYGYPSIVANVRAAPDRMNASQQ